MGKEKKRKDEKRAYVLLHNVRSAENVGSIFRTADAVNIEKIFLGGYTPSPVDRFGRDRKDIAKSALGAETGMPWESVGDSARFLRKLKKQKIFLVAIEQDAASINYRKTKVSFPACFIFGNEVEGLPKAILQLCDTIAEIPMLGKKESLNVSVAVGVSLFEFLRTENTKMK